MKDKLITILTVVLIGALLVLLQSCKKDDVTPGEEDVFKGKISKTWKVKKVTVDGVDVTNSFNNLTVTFRADGSYVVTNSVAPIWPANGTFKIVKSGDEFNIQRNNGLTVDVTSLTDSGMILELLYTASAGRVKEVTGRYKFEMIL